MRRAVHWGAIFPEQRATRCVVRERTKGASWHPFVLPLRLGRSGEPLLLRLPTNFGTARGTTSRGNTSRPPSMCANPGDELGSMCNSGLRRRPRADDISSPVAEPFLARGSRCESAVCRLPVGSPFASLSAGQVNGPQRMVSARCSDGMGANRAWSSAKVCDMATCEHSAMKPQVASAKPPGGQRRTGVAPQTRRRLSLEAVVEVSLSKVAKLEKALEVLGDTEGPVYEAMQAELKRAKSAAQLRRPIGTMSVFHREGQKANLRLGSREGESRGGVEGGRGVWFDWRPRWQPLSLGRTSGQSPCAVAKDGGRTRRSVGRSASEAQGCVSWPGSCRASHTPMPGLIIGS